MASVSEAGGVVVRLEGGVPRFLLVTAKDNPQHWLFPKGHVEAGETPGQAALREVQEEAGVRGRLLDPLGAIEFQYKGRTIHVQFFLIEFLDQQSPQEQRQQGWYSCEEALARLSFEDSRRLLRDAQPAIAARLRPAPPGSLP
jgi:mutator protein MutT